MEIKVPENQAYETYRNTRRRLGSPEPYWLELSANQQEAWNAVQAQADTKMEKMVEALEVFTLNHRAVTKLNDRALEKAHSLLVRE